MRAGVNSIAMAYGVISVVQSDASNNTDFIPS